jgi:hypothetical protein
MQGYLDLQREEWDAKRQVLTGLSKIVGGDLYTVTLALNGHTLGKLDCANKQVQTRLSPPKDGVAEFSLSGPENATVEWSVSFGPEPGSQEPTSHPEPKSK